MCTEGGLILTNTSPIAIERLASTLRHVFDGKKNGRMVVALIENLPRIEEHGPLADVGKFMQETQGRLLYALGDGRWDFPACALCLSTTLSVNHTASMTLLPEAA